MSAERRPTFESRLGEGLNPGTLPLSDEEVATIRSAIMHGATWRGFDGPDGVSKDEALEYAAQLVEGFDAERSARLEMEARAEAAEARVAALTDLLRRCAIRPSVISPAQINDAVAPPETPGEEPKR